MASSPMPQYDGKHPTLLHAERYQETVEESFQRIAKESSLRRVSVVRMSDVDMLYESNLASGDGDLDVVISTDSYEKYTNIVLALFEKFKTGPGQTVREVLIGWGSLEFCTDGRMYGMTGMYVRKPGMVSPGVDDDPKHRLGVIFVNLPFIYMEYTHPKDPTQVVKPSIGLEILEAYQGLHSEINTEVTPNRRAYMGGASHYLSMKVTYEDHKTRTFFFRFVGHPRSSYPRKTNLFGTGLHSGDIDEMYYYLKEKDLICDYDPNILHIRALQTPLIGYPPIESAGLGKPRDNMQRLFAII